MEPIRILITGAGGIVGQGIMKSLRCSSLSVKMIIADIDPLNAGLFRGEEGVLIPKVEEKGALDSILDIIRKKKIQVVMIGSAFDLLFFAKHKDQIEGETGALVIVSPLETVRIAGDKWMTVAFLRDHGFPYPRSFMPENIDEAVVMAEDMGYPVILKPRFGTGSRGMHLVRDEHQLRKVFDVDLSHILQQCISLPEGRLKDEFTCSAFTCKKGKVVGTFVARRVLKGGNSVIVEVVDVPEIHSLVQRIAESLPSMGSLNVQLMLGKTGPVPFELNARLSGTIATRAHFGFNETEMVLRSYFLGEHISPPVIRKGLSLSYKEDVFLEGFSANDLLAPPFPMGDVRTWF